MIFKKWFQRLLLILLVVTNCFSFVYATPDNERISLFPLDQYSQTISQWINPKDPDYHQPFLHSNMQQKHMERFYDHYLGKMSPWDAEYIKKIITSDIKTMEQSIINSFSNQNKSTNQIGYSENFRPHSLEWINQIQDNIPLSILSNLNFQPTHRAIAIDNLHARALPTEDVHFYHHQLPGQGYPFDNLQMSAIWAGTPLYVISKTHDHAWSLVVTPAFIGWVKSNGIAYTNAAFINTWQSHAKKNLAAIIKTPTAIINSQNQFLFNAYIGSVFPAKESALSLQLFIPVRDDNNQATIQTAIVSKKQAAIMPIPPTPYQFAYLLKSQIGRPYGWGGMYFYNDCSAELKSILTPFGIWLPRNSSDQVQVSHMIDMSFATKEKRIDYLMQTGKPFTTLVYIGGHVFLYLGNRINPNSQTADSMALTYQNIWGLKPNPDTRRAVIGQSVIFPLLLEYPEDSTLESLAGKKYFQIAYLDQDSDYFHALNLSLKSLMQPAD